MTREFRLAAYRFKLPANYSHLVAELLRKIRALPRDQSGAMSLVSVFAVLLLTILLGMVMNVGKAADHKIRMQNAADAVAYSGGVAIARGLNALAFSNHLLCDVFALTAFMREARDRNAEGFVPEILAAWNDEAPIFAQSNFAKFTPLATAIPAKTPLEQELVRVYSDWAAAASERILPTLEFILAEELIPQYQRAVTAAFPDIAQQAALEVARRNGRPDFGRGEMLGVLWRTSVVPVGGPGEWVEPTLPVVDPVNDVSLEQPQNLADAQRQRRSQARRYLGMWNSRAMYFFDREAKMSRFSSLWRNFTCGQLEQLLGENETRNLPFLIRETRDEIVNDNEHLDRHFTFIGVAYWQPMRAMLPGVFRHPLTADTVTFAQVRVFVPQRRLVWMYIVPGSDNPVGGIPGDFPELPSEDETAPPPGGGHWEVVRQSVPEHWDLWNQHWACQLTPATVDTLPAILQTRPPLPEFAGWRLQLPNLSGLSAADIQQISPH
ncbi:MAG: Tad domain-containing protein [Thermogutta sp.]